MNGEGQWYKDVLQINTPVPMKSGKKTSVKFKRVKRSNLRVHKGVVLIDD